MKPHTSQTFLQSLAEAYSSRYSDLSEFCFVFPNKRAGTFFLHELKKHTGDTPRIAPEVTAIADLVEKLSGRIVDDRIDQLFTLYTCYCRMLGKSTSDQDEDHLDFSQFRTWGDTALSDFSEIDLYGVNPDAIFKNVKDYREITSDFLTDEQKKVMEEYFGYRPDVEKEADRFWKEFAPAGDLSHKGAPQLSESKSRFLSLWQIMAPLYHRFHENLSERGLTTTGGSYRLAHLRLSESPRLRLPYKKMVFSGFNALSLMERNIMADLLSYPEYQGPDGPEPFVDFFWDATGPVLSDPALARGATRFVRRNMLDFPEPLWAKEYKEKSDVGNFPERLEVISAPSNAMQAKIAGRELRKWLDAGGNDQFADARVAVVLPDEDLLLPMLYSLPDGIEKVNLTMGYSLKLTSTMSFVAVYRYMQSHVREFKGQRGFYHKDLRRLLAHPYAVAVYGSFNISRITHYIDRYHVHTVVPSLMHEAVAGLPDFLRPLSKDASAAEGAADMHRTLLMAAGAMSRNGNGKLLKNQLDSDHINLYLNSLDALIGTLAEHNISVNANTLFTLADRMLAKEVVRFEGEPVEGLQIMGMLETRALDFDRVVIPSLNDRILPVRGRTRSFIPNSLRAGYRMPPVQHQEELSSYYFYRLISRAKEAVMIYDGRGSSGGRCGDVSRYVQQLKYLYARDVVKFEDCTFALTAPPVPVMKMDKSQYVMDMLATYMQPKGKNMSATSLKTYCACGLRFYYEHVVGINTDREPSPYINAAEQGEIIHLAMQNLYVENPDMQKILLQDPIVLDESFLKGLLADPPKIKTAIRRAINGIHYRLPPERIDEPLTGSCEMIAPQLENWIRNIIACDLRQAPIKLYGVEINGKSTWPISKGRNVNFHYLIDRVDVPVHDTPARNSIPRFVGNLRIVDYKTGSDSLTIDDYQDLWNNPYRSKALIQMALYAEMMQELLLKPENRRLASSWEELKIQPVLYSVGNMTNTGANEGIKLVKINSEDKGYRQVYTGSTLQKVFREGTSTLSQHNAGTEAEGSSDCHPGRTDEETHTHTGGINGILEELFDVEKPFRAAANPKDCTFCPLSILCGR